jgi:G3E family GTPase
MPLSSVTILASVHPLAREQVIVHARLQRPELAVLQHELVTLPDDGCVHRVVRSPEGDTEHAIPVDAGRCLSCLVRDDTLAALDELGPIPVLLVLPACVEPAMIALALHETGTVRVDTLVTVVDIDAMEDELWASRALGGGDPRRVAEVLGRQLEHADIVLHATADARAAALLRALTPTARPLPLDVDVAAWLGAGHHDPQRLHRWTATAVPRPHTPFRHDVVATAVWSRRRPLHPQRFLDACEDGTFEGVVRASGHLWIATRPRTVLEIEVTGQSYEVAAVDAWLVALPRWDRAGKDRRDVANRRWHPYWGDRASDLVLTCVERDADEVLGVLDACLLTDGELAEGEEGWLAWPDPFAAWFGDEADLLAPDPNAPDPNAPDEERS